MGMQKWLYDRSVGSGKPKRVRITREASLESLELVETEPPSGGVVRLVGGVAIFSTLVESESLDGV